MISRSCFWLFLFLITIVTSSAQLVLNVDSSNETVWFTSSDVGSSVDGQAVWRTGTISGASTFIGVLTALSSSESNLNDAQLSLWEDGGVNLYLPTSNNNSMTVTGAGSSVAFSYAGATAAQKTALESATSLGLNAGSGFNAMTVSAVPEPSSYAMILGSFTLGGVGFRRRRRVNL